MLLGSSAVLAKSNAERNWQSWILIDPEPTLYEADAGSRTWAVRETTFDYGVLPGAGGRRETGPEADDALTALGEEIMTLSEHLAAETHGLLLLIAEFDHLQGWKLHGFSSCAEWLAWSTRIDRVTAREKVRVARALAGLPETSAAMSRGELSFSQVRAITRVADDENELELLEHARSTSAAGLERLARSWRRLNREDEAALERRLHESRCLSIFPDDQGMYLVRGKLDPEVGALLMRAIEAASDALYRGSVPETTPEQRRADALGLLAERALAAGFGHTSNAISSRKSGEPEDGMSNAMGENESGESADSVDEEPLDASAEAPGVSSEACRAERYLVVLHVDASTLAEGDEPGRSEMEDGTRVSAETARRLGCDTALVRVPQRRNGTEVEVEGRTRTVPLRLRRALEVRDRGCRFPGCGSRFTDAHHIKHWADGGATRLDNLILLCKTHHRLLHEGGFRLQPDPNRTGRPIFYCPRGIRIPEVPPQMTLDGRPFRRGTGRETPDKASPTTVPRWEQDVPLALYLRTVEAIS